MAVFETVETLERSIEEYVARTRAEVFSVDDPFQRKLGFVALTPTREREYFWIGLRHLRTTGRLMNPSVRSKFAIEHTFPKGLGDTKLVVAAARLSVGIVFEGDPP